MKDFPRLTIILLYNMIFDITKNYKDNITRMTLIILILMYTYLNLEKSYEYVFVLFRDVKLGKEELRVGDAKQTAHYHRLLPPPPQSTI